MQRDQAQRELAFIRELVERTRRRVDPHAFHYVHWGALVLLWFPIGNWLELAGRRTALIALNVGAVVLGCTLSALREARLRRRPRIAGEDTLLTKQIVLVVYSSVIAGMILSAVAPEFGLIRNADVPILWGIVYANLAFMSGVVYTRDFLWSGAFIFAGVVAAIVFRSHNGYILGPFMGLGMIVPGLLAESRVRRLAETERGSAPRSV
jgi:hypothetical protein